MMGSARIRDPHAGPRHEETARWCDPQEPAFLHAWERAYSRSAQRPNGHVERWLAVSSAMGPGVHPRALLVGNEQDAGVVLGRVGTHPRAVRVGYARLTLPGSRTLDIVDGGLLVSERHAHAAGVALGAMLDQRAVARVVINRVPQELWDLASSVCSSALSRDRSLRCRVAEPVANVTFDIVPGSIERTMSALSKKRRHEVRREGRVLERELGPTLRLVQDRGTEGIGRILLWAQRVSQRTYKETLGVGFGATPVWRAMIETAASRGTLRSWFFVLGDRPIAFALGVREGRTFYLESMGFDPEHARLSPGKQVLLRAVESLCFDGVDRLDYGAGDAPYKRVFGTRARQVRNFEIIGGGLDDRLVDRACSAVNTAHNTIAHCAQHIGASATLKRAWRRQLTKGNGSEP